MAKSRDSGLGSEELETLRDLFGPLTSAVRDTVVKLVERNKGKGGDNEVSLWAAQQVKNMVDHAANYTAAKIIKSEEERKRKENEAQEQEKMKKEEDSKELEEAAKARPSPGGKSVEDHGTVIKCPWRKKKRLGRGGFGVVYHAVDSNGLEFAVEEVEREGTDADCLKDEIACLAKLEHENIVKYFGYAVGHGRIFMYIELMAGSVRDKMEREKAPLSIDVARKYTSHIAKGLVYLHGENLVHRDIKCANVLLDSTDNAKLADMGLSKTHDQQTLLEYDDAAGTILWMSPEAMTKHTAGKRSDVWSLGCTVYEMIKFGPPFYQMGTLGFLLIIPRIQAGELAHRRLIDGDEQIAGSLKSFLRHIFVKLENRPYAQDIAQHK